jgi:hypothetical protein
MPCRSHTSQELVSRTRITKSPSQRGGRSGERAEYAPTIALDSSEQAIMAAVNDAANPRSTYAATQASLDNAGACRCVC